MTSWCGFAETIAASEALLVRELDLEPIPLAPELEHAIGTWKGTPVTIDTRAYRGARVRYARFATVLGESLEIGNLLCIPEPVYPVLTLGADLVGIRRDLAMLAADLSLTVPAGALRDAQIAQVGARRACHHVPDGGALPEWCVPWFSPAMLYTRVTSDELPAALAAFHEYPACFIDLLRSAAPVPASASEVLDLQQRYATAHRIDDKGLGLLAKMFGADWAGRYLSEVLFPTHDD